ncbi:MAG: sulfite exporter TauE/SafE family protein [Pseudomonadota bacterium]|nr:sulfite exporter TauE/SafE family protein [Pseudomonadota bacterium]
MNIKSKPKTYLWIWILWVMLFYAVWLATVIYQDQWQTIQEHWPIALSMALGSYAAGSTPMGGGTVGFPVLVMLFDMPAMMGRDFSFAVQSIGMTSASILILVRRQPLAWAMLEGALLGALIGTPLGIFLVAPYVPELWIKLLFAVIWASFGILHLFRLDEISGHTGMTDLGERWDFKVGFMIALFSTLCVASVTGVGIDMVLYSALVLLCRADLKIAIPSSVVIMAFTSIIGVMVNWLGGGFQPGVYENWLAAAPIVILGAPAGVLIVNWIGRKPTLLFVAVLCVGQYLWTCFAEFDELAWGGVVLASIGVLVFLAGFELLRSWGGRLVGERQWRASQQRMGNSLPANVQLAVTDR